MQMLTDAPLGAKGYWKRRFLVLQPRSAKEMKYKGADSHKVIKNLDTIIDVLHCVCPILPESRLEKGLSARYCT